jgi:hypothetical protein
VGLRWRRVRACSGDSSTKTPMGSAPPSRAAEAISAARLRSFTLRFELGHKIMPIKFAPARAACNGWAHKRQQP